MAKPLTLEEIQAILIGGKVRLYVGGILYYTDVFNESHCTRFLASVGGEELINELSALENGDKSASVPWRWSDKYNDDDKCLEQ